MRFYCIATGLFLIVSTILTLIDHSKGGSAATSRPIRVEKRDDQSDWILSLFATHETSPQYKDNAFVLRILNRSGKDAAVWDTCAGRLTYFDGVDGVQSVIKEVQPEESTLTDGLRVRWDVEAPEKVSDFSLDENGRELLRQLPNADKQFIDVNFTASTFSKPGKYKILAVLLRGNVELCRSSPMTITVTP